VYIRGEIAEANNPGEVDRLRFRWASAAKGSRAADECRVEPACLASSLINRMSSFACVNDLPPRAAS